MSFLIKILFLMLIKLTEEDFIFLKTQKYSLDTLGSVFFPSKSRLECFKHCSFNVSCKSARYSNRICTFYDSKVDANINNDVYIKFKAIKSFKEISNTNNSTIINQNHQSIFYIDPKVFDGKIYLEHLSLYNNDLFTLDTWIFKDLVHLKVLVLSYNKFLSVGDFLKPLINLEYLSFKKNKISIIHEESFTKLIELKKLFLEENKLKELSKNAFSNLTKLELLNISSNRISTISNETFKNLNFLLDLDLSKNKISKLDSSIFENMNKLISLNLSSNEINFINKDSFKGLINIKNLILGHNNLTFLDKIIFDNLTNLIVLDLSFNNLKTIDFGYLENLKLLNLKNNQLKNFRTNLTSLKELNLGNNPLGYLNYSISDIEGIYDLEIIYLDNCNLTLVTKEAFCNLKNLSYIALISNPHLKIEENNFESLMNLTKIILDEHLRNTSLNLYYFQQYVNDALNFG